MLSTQELYASAIAETRVLLESLASQGNKTLPLAPEVASTLQHLNFHSPAAPELESTPKPVFAPHGSAGFKPAAPPSPPLQPSTSPLNAGPKEQALAVLAAQVCACTSCGLHDTRTQTVFGVGNPDADIVFVGEAPGAEEDRQGVPFVGRAGQLLNDIIEKGMGIKRENVYICNVLKCRPPGNRTPSPEEMLMCEPFLLKQLDIIQPKIIVALGKVAAQCLLRSDDAVGRLRGKWHDYHGIPLRVTYHPAYLLRNPADKRLAWDDIKEILKKHRN